MGSGTSGKLVTEVKKQLTTAAKDVPLAVIDGSPGIGCPVIASLSGTDMVLIVAERDDLEEAQSTGALSVARRKMISDLLQSEQAQTEFDRDVFSKLIEVVRVYNRDDITFIFKDGTEVKVDKEIRTTSDCVTMLSLGCFMSS